MCWCLKLSLLLLFYSAFSPLYQLYIQMRSGLITTSIQSYLGGEQQKSAHARRIKVQKSWRQNQGRSFPSAQTRLVPEGVQIPRQPVSCTLLYVLPPPPRLVHLLAWRRETQQLQEETQRSRVPCGRSAVRCCRRTDGAHSETHWALWHCEKERRSSEQAAQTDNQDR